MSHDIQRINGIAEIAYAGDTPWHGLGQRLTADAPIDVWQKEAGLNWQANVAPVAYQPTADSDFVVMNNKFVIYRNDTHAPLGVVTDRYNIHQPDHMADEGKQPLAFAADYHQHLMRARLDQRLDPAKLLFLHPACVTT